MSSTDFADLYYKDTFNLKKIINYFVSENFEPLSVDKLKKVFPELDLSLLFARYVYVYITFVHLSFF